MPNTPNMPQVEKLRRDLCVATVAVKGIPGRVKLGAQGRDAGSILVREGRDRIDRLSMGVRCVLGMAMGLAGLAARRRCRDA